MIALITGANGISGRALVEYLCSRPASEWSSIIGTSRRPALYELNDPRIRRMTTDLMASNAEITRQLQEFGVADVTHFFHYAYVHGVDEEGQVNPWENVDMWKNTLDAVDATCPQLQRVFLQLGIKYYGVHVRAIGDTLVESMGRYAHPGKDIFYYPQEDYLLQLSRQRTWGWNEAMPAYVYGPSRGNGMSFGTSAAIFFTVVKFLNEEITFPGSMELYNGVQDMSGTRAMAELETFVCTTDAAANQNFNVVDGAEVTFAQIWKSMCTYFGVRVQTGSEWNTMDYMKNKEPVYREACARYGGNSDAFGYATWAFFDSAFRQRTRRSVSMEKAKEFGFEKTYDTCAELEGFFDRMRSSGDLPTIPREHA